MSKAKKRSKSMGFFLVIALVILGIVLFQVYSPFAKTCKDDICFTKNSDSCKYVKFEQIQDGNFIDYVSKNCVLVKTVSKVNDSEIREVKDSIEGKSMVCRYSKGNFDPQWVSSLSLGFERCEGDLKDGVENLIQSAFTD